MPGSLRWRSLTGRAITGGGPSPASDPRPRDSFSPAASTPMADRPDSCSACRTKAAEVVLVEPPFRLATTIVRVTALLRFSVVTEPLIYGCQYLRIGTSAARRHAGDAPDTADLLRY